MTHTMFIHFHFHIVYGIFRRKGNMTTAKKQKYIHKKENIQMMTQIVLFMLIQFFYEQHSITCVWEEEKEGDFSCLRSNLNSAQKKLLLLLIFQYFLEFVEMFNNDIL